ncbi:MAG: AraC family transcriptional regulator [Bacteroidota bacterium]
MVLDLRPAPLQIIPFDSPTKLQKETLNFKEVVIHSKLAQFEKRVDHSGLSIKMALRGEENYNFSGTHVLTDPDHFIIANEGDSFTCCINDTEQVKAFCLYLDPESLRQAIRSRSLALDILLDHEEGPQLDLAPFPAFQHSIRQHAFGLYLQNVKEQLLAGEDLPDETLFFTELTEHLADYYLSFYQKLRNIPSKKQSTKVELLRRLEIAYDFIQSNYQQAIQLDELARVATLSKFHLLRTFRSVYQVTPYQLVLQLRLAKAKELLLDGELIERIAFQLGFSDRRSFTKAFRRNFAQSPSAFRAQN